MATDDKARDDEDEDRDDDDDEGDDDESDAPEEKKTEEKKAAVSEKKPEKKPEPAKKAAAATPAKSAVKRPAAKRPAPPTAKGGSLGKSMILFVIIVGGLAAGFAILGADNAGGPAAKPKWTAGQTVDVEITLVRGDNADLACASADEFTGKHCAFEAENKPWSKGPSTDDKVTLRPYTTTDRIQFVAAGLWSDPALTPDKLPATRFNAKCKMKVEGTTKKLGIRWNATENKWYQNDGWYVGTISGCTLIP
jgi:hypothetical protein